MLEPFGGSGTTLVAADRARLLSDRVGAGARVLRHHPRPSRARDQWPVRWLQSLLCHATHGLPVTSQGGDNALMKLQTTLITALLIVAACVGPGISETDGFTSDGSDSTETTISGDGDPGCADGDAPQAAPSSCADLDPGSPSGVYLLDVDGPGGNGPADGFCEMDVDFGGWTLVFTSSDDGPEGYTWTWDNREYMGLEPFEIGSADEPEHDYMGPAYHALPVQELLFAHQPSGVTAIYDVGDGRPLSLIVESSGSPVCGLELADKGYPLVGGTLELGGKLCDTDLYFNLGDHEQSVEACEQLGWQYNNATYGPVWNADNGHGCPFDDPSEFGLGPSAPCMDCVPETASREWANLGFANALGLNTATRWSGDNYMQIYVR